MTIKKFVIAIFSLTVPFLIFSGYIIATGQGPSTTIYWIGTYGLISIYVMGVLYCYIKLKNKNESFSTIYFAAGSGWLMMMGFCIPIAGNNFVLIFVSGFVSLIGTFLIPLFAIAISSPHGGKDHPDFETLFNIKNNWFRDDRD